MIEETLYDKWLSLPDNEKFEQLFEILNKSDLRLYGLSLKPTDLNKLRKVLLSRGINPVTLEMFYGP